MRLRRCGARPPLAGCGVLFVAVPSAHRRLLLRSPTTPALSFFRYAAEIAHNVSSRKRKEIVERAEQLNIKILTGAARLKAEENE